MYMWFDTVHNGYGALISAGMEAGFVPAAARYGTQVTIACTSESGLDNTSKT